MRLWKSLALVMALFMPLALPAAPAQAQGRSPQAEAFITGHIGDGLAILRNTALTAPQRAGQFQDFLLGITDIRRIALFTLGSYARGASPADTEAFVQAFQNYAVSVYRSYFMLYSGQSLNVTGSQARSADDAIVATAMRDPSGKPPLKIDFRVRMDGPKPVVTDIGFAGVWLALAQRDDFTSFLGRNGGDVKALTAHLNDVAKTYGQK